jgi:hypothetical protein
MDKKPTKRRDTSKASATVKTVADAPVPAPTKAEGAPAPAPALKTRTPDTPGATVKAAGSLPAMATTPKAAVTTPSQPAPVAAPKSAPKPATANRTTPITVEAKIDVGFGNALFVRGQGPGLSWERGVPMMCVDGKTWRWSTAGTEKLTFKLLLNDAVWAQGADQVVAPGQRLETTPAF